jgi:O-acetyl-ADP-ribose deacetylase (regulator of RNase III)
MSSEAPARCFGSGRVELVLGDLTLQAVDAIVNAANSSLLGGGGVDGAIHRGAGPSLLEEGRRLREDRLPGGLPPGQAVITGAGRLPARHVIHTVGPVWHGGGDHEAEVLASCYRSALGLAAGRGLASVAFPSISTGAFGYPVALASRTALRTVRSVLEAGAPIALVRFVLFSPRDLAVYAAALAEAADETNPRAS